MNYIRWKWQQQQEAAAAVCLEPGCEKLQKTRGLCHACYNRLHKRGGTAAVDARVAELVALTGNEALSGVRRHIAPRRHHRGAGD